MTNGPDAERVEILAERIAELERDNTRLRRLLDQRDAPGELRHRLRSTLALLRAIVRRSAEAGCELPDYVAHLEDRLDAIARAQALADQHGEVDLRALLADELFQYKASEGEQLLLTGPDVRLQPRAGQVLALAIHELAVNAVEHGVLGTDGGRVEVSWTVTGARLGAEPGTMLAVTWTEVGLPPGAGSGAEPARRQGFGTEVLTRMLPYELKAETQLVHGLNGTRCRVRLPMPEQVGRVIPG